MSREKRTLIVAEIRNLTDEDIWTYGTSGEMMKLGSYKLDDLLKDEDFRPEYEPNIYYLASGRDQERIEANWKFSGRIAKASYYGSGRFGEKLYHFTNENGIPLVPVADEVGVAGESRSEELDDPFFKD